MIPGDWGNDTPRRDPFHKTTTMKLYIKNMVCSRCRMAVEAELNKAGLKARAITLGSVDLEEEPPKEALRNFNDGLVALGFELIDDRKSRIIEQVKNSIIELVHHSDEQVNVNLSTYLSTRLHYDYNYLSNLFSAVEGTTIEKYFIAQKIEKVKELLMYDELTLSEISDRLGYSSVAYLSGQFKKVTGLTPTYYKSLRADGRRNIEEL